MHRLSEESSVGSVLRPYPNTEISVTILGEQKLFIGIEQYHDGRKFLKLFTTNDKGVCLIDTLYFWAWMGKKERDRRIKPFQWDEFTSPRRMSREEVKQRLRSLRFDPAVVDVVYPAAENDHKTN